MVGRERIFQHPEIHVTIGPDRGRSRAIIGQDGVVRKTEDQVMRATYAIEPGDTYIRTVIRTLYSLAS